MHLIFVFAQCCWSIHSKSGKAWQECAQQTKKNHSHTNSAVTRQVYVDALYCEQVLFTTRLDQNSNKKRHRTKSL